MVSKELLKDTIQLYNSICKTLEITEISNSGFADKIYQLFDSFIEACGFTEEGIDLFYWWMYEDVEKVIYESPEPDLFNKSPEKTEVSVKTLDELWDYILKNKNIYLK
jgi:hypothetical protein